MRLLICALAVSVSVAPALAAQNTLVIDRSNDVLNTLALTLDGDDNQLGIRQEYGGDGSDANVMSVNVRENGNGGSAVSMAKPLIAGLSFGTLLQSGQGNAMNVDVTGSDNLFAFTQQGMANSLSAVIQGQHNQAAVSQMGAGNVAGFSQVGSGNIVSISQRSW